ncbi:hypothetical protein Sango_0491100 [Sesamum angolense]|uniref:Uncharacterized protein n=1 Tax=Sesamum angolense TaxID=2727404 RepID=A0AAE2C4U3_9LAMI|nr:hypothetical protein Sango_0491100 [Sesamum angolense]
MPRQNLNVDVRIGGRKCKVRKRGCSSSSSSSLVENYRLKRAFLVGKRVGSTTPVPMWKMMGSKSPSLENDKAFKYLAAKGGERAKELSVSARKLAATLWEIDGWPSPRVKRESLVDEVGVVRKERILESSKLGSMVLALSDLFHSPVSQRMDPPKVGSHRRRASADQNSTSLSLFSALKFELDRACIHVCKLIQEQKVNRSEIDVMFKHFEEEKMVWKLKEQDRIRSAITSIAGELETEKKLRRQTERLNKKLGRELAETKASLSKQTKDLESEKRARQILEQVCDELARGIGEDRAEVEELKKQSAKVREEVEKEREMLQLADVLREERVQMKLLEAKYQFEEKNALVDNLRNELEAYLKSKTGEEQPDGSPSYDKIKELEKYLRETLPGSCQYQDKDKEDVVAPNKEEEGEEEDDDDSADSDLHSIELTVDDISKSFQWSDAIKNETKRNLVDKTWKKDVEDELERYNMIKDLRDHIVSGSRMVSSEDLATPSQHIDQPILSSKDPNGLVCQAFVLDSLLQKKENQRLSVKFLGPYLQ